MLLDDIYYSVHIVVKNDKKHDVIILFKMG